MHTFERHCSPSLSRARSPKFVLLGSRGGEDQGQEMARKMRVRTDHSRSRLFPLPFAAKTVPLLAVFTSKCGALLLNPAVHG